MKRGTHSDAAPQVFPKTAQWFQHVTWISENTKALHAGDDCQLNEHFCQGVSLHLKQTVCDLRCSQWAPEKPFWHWHRSPTHVPPFLQLMPHCCAAERDPKSAKNTSKEWPFTAFETGSEWGLCTTYAAYFRCLLMERSSRVFHDYVATQNF